MVLSISWDVIIIFFIKYGTLISNLVFNNNLPGPRRILIYPKKKKKKKDNEKEDIWTFLFFHKHVILKNVYYDMTLL